MLRSWTLDRNKGGRPEYLVEVLYLTDFNTFNVGLFKYGGPADYFGGYFTVVHPTYCVIVRSARWMGYCIRLRAPKVSIEASIPIG